MSELKFLIIGAGGHARAVIAALKSTGREIEGILDTDYKGQDETIMGVKVLGSYGELLSGFSAGEVNIALAIGDIEERRSEYERLTKLGYTLPPVIHSSAIFSKDAVLGSGVFIGPGAIIGPIATIGNNSIINTGAIIDHETRIGDHSHICPGVRIAGRVTVGTTSFIGIGSSIIDGICIGDNVKVGAGSVVIKDIGSGATVAGVPARERK